MNAAERAQLLALADRIETAGRENVIAAEMWDSDGALEDNGSRILVDLAEEMRAAVEQDAREASRSRG